MKLEKKTFKKMFPNLTKELEDNENTVSVNSVRTNIETGEEAVCGDRFAGYTPDVVDFIRRCETEAEAEEIIAYMEKRGEIGKPYAEKLRKQLKAQGVRSFGSKKEENYYFKHGGL